jgi:riboflavin kinase/FMN adenylyltransferase
MKQPQNAVIAIGNFDGVHLGHQKIMSTLKVIAEEKQLHSIVLTFTPSPKKYFHRENNFINTDQQKNELLKQFNPDQIVFIDFGQIHELSPQEFVFRYLIKQYKMKHIIMGKDFAFGKYRQGNIQLLKQLAEIDPFEITVIEPKTINQEKISSSTIRQMLRNGKILSANKMLGKYYFIDGIVIGGKKLGRSLGFPTINLQTENTILPTGVFSTISQIADHSYQSITNIGFRPSFNGTEISIETHILNFNNQIYQQPVRLFFKKKLRDEIKFASKEELIVQIKHDIAAISAEKD